MQAHAEATISPVCFERPRSETHSDEEVVSSSSLIFLVMVRTEQIDDEALRTTRVCLNVGERKPAFVGGRDGLEGAPRDVVPA